MKKMILAVVAVMSGFAGNAAPILEVRIASVAVEGAPINGLSADARAELERHLAVVGAMGASRPTDAALTIVLGEKAPSEGEPEAHTQEEGGSHSQGPGGRRNRGRERGRCGRERTCLNVMETQRDTHFGAKRPLETHILAQETSIMAQETHILAQTLAAICGVPL